MELWLVGQGLGVGKAACLWGQGGSVERLPRPGLGEGTVGPGPEVGTVGPGTRTGRTQGPVGPVRPEPEDGTVGEGHVPSNICFPTLPHCPLRRGG